MQLNEGQNRAVDGVADMLKRFPNGGGVMVISGYAGTGKSTTLSAILEIYPDTIILAPTGKAALRVKEITEHEATTIHRWQYTPTEDEETGDVSFGLKDLGEVAKPDSNLLIVDEASMVGLDIFKNLYAYAKDLGLNLLLIGDGFQLPPVDVGATTQFSIFHDAFPAHLKVELTEIFRQAWDSPIIRASAAIRNSKHPSDALSELDVISFESLAAETARMYEDGSGVVLCHRNATRHAINVSTRKHLGYSAEVLVEKEPLLVTRNNYVLDVYNGEIYQASNIRPLDCIAVSDRTTNSSVYTAFSTCEIGTMGKAVISDREIFGTNKEVGLYRIAKSGAFLARKKLSEPPPYLSANLGYALSIHKSQGSEWTEVLVAIEDSMKLHTVEGRRLLYTALTRAKKRVRVVLYREDT